MSVATITDSVRCPFDDSSLALQFISDPPGGGIKGVYWQCLANSHAGFLPIDTTPPPKGTPARADSAAAAGGLGLINTQPPTRIF